MSLTNSSLPIQIVSNTNSQYYLTVQNFTQGQTNKELINPALLWKNNELSINGLGIQVSSTSNLATTFTTSSSPPRQPKPDDTWYDTLSDIIFRYIDDGTGKFQWVDISSLSNFGNTIPFIFPTSDIKYLIVGGGGSGGRYGGGGAGGVVCGTIPLVNGTPYNYSIVVGAGGQNINACDFTVGKNGSNSSITGSFGTVQTSTIVGLGGGGGGQSPPAGGAAALDGGSGGGGGASTAGTGLQPIQNFGVPNLNNRGFPGGNAGGTTSGGGGGGAGAVGASTCISPGGAGYTWPVTNLAYGGGGGMGSRRACSGGAGGTGGGGCGGRQAPNGPLVPAVSGTNGRGGGGGGAGGTPMPGGSGGSGTVILAVPNAAYPYVLAPGADVTTPPAAPGYTVLTYTASNPSSPSTYTFIGPSGCNPDTNSISMEYLAVGGGGGGGNGIQTTVQGGGGAGGGVVTGTLVLPRTNPGGSYVVTVGTGGLGGSAPNNLGTSGLAGNNSTITANGISGTISITALGGGYGSGWNPSPGTGNPGGSGGSGGGAGNQPSAPAAIGGSSTQPARTQSFSLFNSGTTSTNYGNSGGNATAHAAGGPDSAGGGGGANTAGSNGIASAGGPGGSGYLWPFTGGTYGAGAGGAGFSSGGISFGGGTGAGQKTGIANTTHTGGVGWPGYGAGGGGGYGSSVLTQQGSGGSGGPGAVIFAYRSNTILYTGGCISTPSLAPGYIVHTFTSPGTLSYSVSPAETFAMNYLVVGGGGAGGASLGNINNGGGGGAGGMLYGTTLGTPGKTYTISVGAGGTGTPLGLPTNNGNPSSLSAPGFTTVTASGGGAGGGMLTVPATTRGGQPGSSGGGAFGYGSPLVGTGTAGQGNPGGSSALGGPGANNFGGGGGGGAGTSGIGGSPYHGGCGGSGKLWPYTNSYYAGGGGGSNSQQPGSIGLGGLGGGGQGSWTNASIGRAGAPGLGGGGGGGNSTNPAVPAGLVAGFPGGPGSVIIIAPTPRGVTATGTIGLSYTGISGSGSFTGTPQYLTTPNSTALDLSNQSFTIEGWIYPMGVYSTWNTIISKRGILAASSAWEVGLSETTGYLYFWNGGTVYTSSVAPISHSWNHFAAVYDGVNINLYLNGSRIFQTSITNTVDQANNVIIGTAIAETVSQSFIGYISNLRVSKANTRYADVTYTLPTEPFTSDVDTSLLTLQSGSSITDASINAANISNYGPVTASFISPFSSANGTTVYDFTTPGTITFGAVGGPKVLNSPTTIQYLVVAGGGAGGRAYSVTTALSGGGGAGGVLTGSLSAVPGIPFTIQVGGGGAARPGCTTSSGPNFPGMSSNIAQVSMTTINAVGGGGGGANPSAGSPVIGAQPGGSGAGGPNQNSPVTLVGPNAAGTGTPGQGFSGANGTCSAPPTQATAGGGGGAGSAGNAGTPVVPSGTISGVGGIGVTWTYTGPGTYYAGGGGGSGNKFFCVGRGAGGLGGGGQGGQTGNFCDRIAGVSGTANTGGGGGGGGGCAIAGTGGSGVVKLAIPNAAYPTVSAPGATISNPPAAPGMTVITYTTANPLAPSTFIFTP